MNDSIKKNILSKICEELTKRQRKAILIGESKYHKELLQEIPLAADFDWLNRPINMELLGETVVEETGKFCPGSHAMEDKDVNAGNIKDNGEYDFGFVDRQ